MDDDLRGLLAQLGAFDPIADVAQEGADEVAARNRARSRFLGNAVEVPWRSDPAREQVLNDGFLNKGASLQQNRCLLAGIRSYPALGKFCAVFFNGRHEVRVSFPLFSQNARFIRAAKDGTKQQAKQQQEFPGSSRTALIQSSGRIGGSVCEFHD